MVYRRIFLKTVMAFTAAGVLVPEHLLVRGRSKTKELPSWLIDRLKYARLSIKQLREILDDWREGIDISDRLEELVK